MNPRMDRRSVFVISTVAFVLVFANAIFGQAAQHYEETGLVLKVDRAKRIVIVSCDSIPSIMDAMVMPLAVRNDKSLDGLQPGMKIEFSLLADEQNTYAENLRVRPYESMENDPPPPAGCEFFRKCSTRTEQRKRQSRPDKPVPDFALSDQNQQKIALSQFAGKVVAVTFVYVRCPFPNYCFGSRQISRACRIVSATNSAATWFCSR